MDQYYIDMIYDHFNTVGFYFSYTYDLTRYLEKNIDISNQTSSYSSLIEFNQKYMWNRYLFEPVLHIKEIFQYFLPIIHGCWVLKFIFRCWIL
ncbi:hypothetical protein HZS_1807 [Henneguya salminicola]|nr:hypothetical protein HZS_1807 [Henneguya salminicola]